MPAKPLQIAAALASLVTALCIAPAAMAQTDVQSAPQSMVTLSTGSDVAVWTMRPEQGTRTTPVVFLHGGPGMYTEPRRIEQGAVFRQAGFTTVFYDQVGSGRSARLPATQYTLARMIADLEALRVGLGAERLVLWGNSWGAQLAMVYAQAHPDRVAGLVFTSPGAFPGTNPQRDYSRTNRGRVSLPRALSQATSRIDRQGGRAEPAVDQAASGQLLDNFVSNALMQGMSCQGATPVLDPLPGGANLFVNRMLQREMASVRPDWSRLPQVPTLVVRGSCDFLPMESAVSYQSVTQGEFVGIEGAGHALLEAPDAVTSAITAFLQTEAQNIP